MWVIAAAASIVLPAVMMDDATFVQETLNRGALKDREAGFSAMLWVNPEGRVVDCDVEVVVGSDEVADETCRLLVGRKIKKPKAEGKTSVWGFAGFTSYITKRRPIDPGLMQSLQSRSAAYAVEIVSETVEDSVKTSASLLIDEVGKVANCQMPDGYEVHCNVLRDRPFEVRTDGAGVPVSYVRGLTIILKPN